MADPELDDPDAPSGVELGRQDKATSQAAMWMVSAQSGHPLPSTPECATTGLKETPNTSSAAAI
jgi:hypothetical protein